LIPDNYDAIDPVFDNTTDREVIAALGTTARLHCRVRHLGDRAVSWIRQRDLHILTIGIMTYTNDQRFLARHIDNSDEWVLKIVSVQQRDAGVYECQVSTEPKISLAYKLVVVSKYLSLRRAMNKTLVTFEQMNISKTIFTDNILVFITNRRASNNSLLVCTYH